MLGSSETVGKMSGLFGNDSVYPKVQTEVYKKISELSGFYRLDDIYLSLIDQYMFPCLILNDRGEIVASSESADQYLKSSKGNIHQAFPASLSVQVNAALQRAKKEKKVSFKNVPIYLSGELSFVHLTLKSFFRQYHKLYVLFIEKAKEEAARVPVSGGEDGQLHLQHLYRTVKELEASNDALVSANQKLQEENKKLTALNRAFEKKVNELNTLKNDLNNLLTSTNIAAVFLDQELKLKLFTPEAANMFDLKKEDLSRPADKLTERFNYKEYADDIKRTLYENKTVVKEFEMPNGGWYTVKMIPYYASGKKVEGIVVTFTNVTELKMTNEALHISSQAIDQSPANILLTSVDGSVTYANKRFCRMLEKHPDDLIGGDVFNIYRKHFHCDDLNRFWKHVLDKKPWSGELNYQDREQQDRWEQISLIPVEDSAGNVHQVMLISEDITNQKRSEKMLMKSEMLSAVGQLAAGIAHEIRNPLTSLKGFLQLMIQSKKYQKDYAEVMMSEFIRLEAIINEFLVLAKTKSNTFDPVQVNSIVEDVCMVLESQAVLNNVRIEKQLSGDLPEILAVSNELKQVFINILKNAIEAMEDAEGFITIRSYFEKDSVFITFEDQGKGISKEVLEKLGEPFYTTKEKGTGLGLMVTFKIIENHGGSIHFESEEGKGTIVKLKLPIKE
ncbi:PAS domain-containing sensor histidine kinase [Bacillus paralicheniformis]|uniref:ATP-binding protein n=1 Tax=Bacillus TaxID=1386 RepID=UPI000951A3F9|nr:ATP-binding protein [Bacillus paralicheniformis]MSO01001.1 PAS domain-containing protein [Bacillus paralicheniformis]MSO05009.1 PAS domain-containing protein [Bacillus paralicheniformis]MSO09002.1 PAS domain-containing protein [Bacillus paralicheniformis]MSO12996.1 PAS domain-containing protein [Bacillus paralicheniformis]NJE39507.1 PAS domain-containing protein [Bacillus paralicheniformis]